MINSGMLRDRIVMLAPTTSNNDYGEQAVTWADYYACRARVTYSKGQRAIDGGEIWLPNTIAVLMRYRSGLNDRMRLRWNGDLYRIDAMKSLHDEGRIDIIATKTDDKG